MVFPEMDFMDILVVLLQGGKAHLELLEVTGIFNVCCPETQQKPERAKKSREKREKLRGKFTEGGEKKGKRCYFPGEN